MPGFPVRSFLQDRLVPACGFSLLLHAALLALPSGNIGQIVGIPDSSQLSDEVGYAPLSVLLGPVTLRIPQNMISTSIKKPPPLRTAPAVDAAGKNDGSLAGRKSSRSGDDSSDPLPVTGIPIPHYYHPEELSRRARVVVDIDPFLGSLNDLPGTGKAVLTLWINEHGKVDRVETATSDLGEVFESAILSQFQAMLFQPAEREGVSVKSLMKIEVELLPQSSITQSE